MHNQQYYLKENILYLQVYRINLCTTTLIGMLAKIQKIETYEGCFILLVLQENCHSVFSVIWEILVLYFLSKVRVSSHCSFTLAFRGFGVECNDDHVLQISHRRRNDT